MQKGAFLGEMADSGIHAEYENIIEGYDFTGVNVFRNAKPKELAFAAITAYHLYGWYRDNRYCGRCGRLMFHGENERMMHCMDCKNTVYPKICPAVIVAVTDGDRILLTKYAGRTYRNYALIAGFTEIGETVEETVMREVYEEVGVHVKISVIIRVSRGRCRARFFMDISVSLTEMTAYIFRKMSCRSENGFMPMNLI